MADNKALLAAINAQVAASKKALTTPQPVLNAAPVNGAGYGTKSTVDTNWISKANDKANENTGLINRIIDVISRPAYAVKNVIRDQVDTDPNNNNVLESASAGFLGIDKTMGRDIIEALDQKNGTTTPDWVKGVGGFTGDVLLDPTTYTTFGVGTALSKGIKGASNLLSGTAKYEKAVKAGTGIVADDVTRAEVRALADKNLTNAQISNSAAEVNNARQRFIAEDIKQSNDVLPTVVDTPAPVTNPFFDPKSTKYVDPDKYKAAQEFAVSGYSPSTINILSPYMLQGKLGMTYAEATRAMARMEHEGILGPMARPVASEKTGGKMRRPTFSRPIIRGDIPEAPAPALSPTGAGSFVAGLGAGMGSSIKAADAKLVAARYKTVFENNQFEDIAKILSPSEIKKVSDKAGIRYVPNQAFPVNAAQNDILVQTVRDFFKSNPKNTTIAPKPIVAPGPDGLPVVNTTSRAPAEPLFRDVLAQGTAARAIKVAALKDAAKYEGPLKDQFLTQRMLPELKRIKEENIQKGIYPVVKIGKNEYHIDVADAFGALGPKIMDHYMKPTGRLSASTITTAAARAVQIKQAGITGNEALVALTQNIEKGRLTPRAKSLAQDLWNVVDDLERRVIDNEYTLGHRDLVTGKKIGQDVADETVKKLDDPNIGVAENLQDVANVAGKIKTKADAEGVSVGGALVGAKEATDALKGRVDVVDMEAARSILANSRDIANGASAAKITNRQRALARKDAREYLESAQGARVSLENVTDVTIGNAIQRFYNGIKSRTVHGFRQDELASAYRNWNGPAEVLQHVYTKQISDIYKKFGKDTSDAAFNAIKVSGVAARVTDPEVAAALTDLKPLMEHVLSTSTGPAAGRDIIAESALFRNIPDVKTINMLLKEKGITHQFEQTGSMSEIAQQWRNWDIKDPLDFLSKYQAAVVAGAARSKVGEAFTLKFGKDYHEPGFIKIKQTDAKMSRFIDPEKYYPPEAIHQMRLFNNTFDSPTSFKGQRGAAAWLANNVIDPFLRLWKPSVTVARLGHHIRNIMSDFIINGMAGVWSPRHYIRAANIQRAIGKFTGDSLELEKIMGKKLPDGGATAFNVLLKNGSREPFSYAQAGQLGFKHGLMTSYKAAEDILEKASTNKLDVLTDRIMETGYMRAAARLSELENHQFKIAQWGAMMSNPKFTKKYSSVEDASMAAVTEVQKFHPDTKGLAPFEAKVMRRVMPFYTWFRQAMPVVFNTLLTKPGRVTNVPKAYFNTQVAMGLDPKSMEDPFPADKMYPSFIQEHLTGPLNALGGNFIANTGTPIEGAADIFNGNVPTNIVGMLNPLLKAPLELTQNQQAVSGRYIPDKGEYIDQMIPFVNQLSNISGFSASGSVANVLSGNGPMLDPQRAMEKGEKDFLFNQSTLNFLSGLGIQKSRSSFLPKDYI